MTEIFVPDTEKISATVDGFSKELQMKFGVDSTPFQSLFQSESAVEDVFVDYSIPGVGAFNLKVFDTKYLIQGVTYFRGLIRGFITLLLLFYHIRQVVGFFGYNAGVIAGRNGEIHDSLKQQWKDNRSKGKG